MVGYPSDKTVDLDNSFDLLCWKVWGKKLTQQAQIPVFTQGQNPEDHIKTCENEWRRLGYKDEWAWPHLFPSTLANLPNKWYKMEEARVETFLWHELRENFIKDFNFIPQNENLVETAKQIKQFIQPTENQPLQDHWQIRDCNNIKTWSRPQSTHLQLENENTEGKIFRWKYNHVKTTKPIRTILKVTTTDRQDNDRMIASNFPTTFS